jgi:predicted ATPase/class 3 adenylate cyclase
MGTTIGLADQHLPSGTVTFLFTDIEGSTSLAQRYPDALSSLLAQHHRILHESIAAHHGHVFQVVGDAFSAAFHTASDAVHAALAAQRRLHHEAWSPTPIKVRMGIHTGAAQAGAIDAVAGGYVGYLTLTWTQRIMSIAHGGQTLLSAATQELVRDQLPPDVTLRDMDVHRLKDLTRGERLFQLVAPDLPSDFLPLKTLDLHLHNLPIQPTALIGREQAVATICAVLQRSDVRLVTLTGPGGTGKTRLAVQVAAELVGAFRDGVWFVNLAPISEPALVVATILQALGRRETHDRPLVDQLKDYLREKQLLLLLDNFEQVVSAGPLIAEVLATAPGLKVLATSRVALHLSGEQEIAVAPLGLPPRAKASESTAGGRTRETMTLNAPVSSVAELTQYAAVQLFIERAQAVKADFAVTNANAPAVAEICYRLDGLPLAIELAAVRVKLFPPQTLLARLSSRLQLLTAGPRDLPARQQTIRNTIDWSYQLLEAGQQRLFARLGVFVGGCTLHAVEAICAAEGELEADVLDGLTALVDHSLVRQDEGLDGEPRFVMLETIREYAAERLVASGEREATRSRQAAYYLTLVDTARSGMGGSQYKHWMDRLEQEYDNLRGVLDWASARGETELGLQLGSMLWLVWDARGTITEGRARLLALLAQAQNSPPTPARMYVLLGAGQLALAQGDLAVAQTLAEEGQALAQEIGDPSLIANALLPAGWATFRQGDVTAGRRLIEESLALHRKLGSQLGVGQALSGLAVLSSRQGDYATARSLSEQSLAIAQELGVIYGIADELSHLGEIARIQGDLKLARAHFEQCLAHGRALNNSNWIAHACTKLGYITLNEGDADHATALFQESLMRHWEAERKIRIPDGLVGLGGVADLRRQPERAARLLGAAAALLDAMPATLDPADHLDYERIVANVQAQLDETSYATAWAEGRAMTLEQAIAYALESTA